MGPIYIDISIHYVLLFHFENNLYQLKMKKFRKQKIKKYILMNRLTIYSLTFLLIVTLSVPHNTKAQIEHEPYPVYDTKPVIMKAPYLIDPSETAITVNWMTDTPSHSKVIYGKANSDTLDHVAESQQDGLLAVGTMQSVRLTGLEPGTDYRYKVASRRVVQLNPYWPEMGQWVKSPSYSFTTFDREKPVVSFSVITDTHEHVDWINDLMGMVDWEKTEFIRHNGDAFDYILNEQQKFDKWLTPLSKGLDQSVPLIFARGNHEFRGSYARQLFKYVPIHTDNYYITIEDGPAHLLVMDSGEDKPDTTNVYAGLNRMEQYKEIEYEWFKKHVEESEALKKAPFRIVAMHQPKWGWTGGQRDKWTKLANKANIDLVISGHWHRYDRIGPGEEGSNNEYPILVIGQKQIAHVNVTKQFIIVEVQDIDGELIDSFCIDSEGRVQEKL